jgi:hypothetical protein
LSIVKQGLLGIIGLALGAIWLASAAANFAHGTQLAGNSPYWWIWGLASAGLDVVKAGALIGCVAAWRKGTYLAVLACLLTWTVTTGWGIRSCMGFVATTLEDTVSGRTMHTVADRSLTRQIDDQVGQVTKLQDLKMKAPPRDWERIEAEIGRVEDRLEKLRKRARDTQTVGAADPTGALLDRWIDPRNTRIGTAVLFLLAVEICASLGLVAFAPLFGTKHGELSQKLAEEAYAPMSTPDLPPPGEGDAGVKQKLKLVPPGPLRLQALEQLARLEARYGPGAAVLTDEVFSSYMKLAKERGWEVMPPRKLGQQLVCLGVTKTDPDNQKRKFYVLPTANQKAKRKGGNEEGGLPAA